MSLISLFFFLVFFLTSTPPLRRGTCLVASLLGPSATSAVTPSSSVCEKRLRRKQRNQQQGIHTEEKRVKGSHKTGTKHLIVVMPPRGGSPRRLSFRRSCRPSFHAQHAQTRKSATAKKREEAAGRHERSECRGVFEYFLRKRSELGNRKGQRTIKQRKRPES